MRLIHNAVVHTLDPETLPADALLVDDTGTIVALGEARDLAAHVAGAERIDLGGGHAFPGFIDAHLHALSVAYALSEVDVSAARSMPEAVARVADFARDLPAGQWVTGGRWDFNRWDVPVTPTREPLDTALGDRHAVLWSIDYHTAWCNTAALRAAGITADTPDPVGGRIERDAHGAPTGLLRESAADLVEECTPKPALDVRVEALRTAQSAWLAEGITGIHEIDGLEAAEAWAAFREVGALGIRVVKYLQSEELDLAREKGLHSGFGDHRFSIGGLKLFSDGALGSHTAHMSRPYRHEPGNHGVEVMDLEALVSSIRESLDLGLAPAVHAIGDAANTRVLDAFEATTGDFARARERFGHPIRPRIEHAQFVQPADLARYKDLGVVASMQPTHCTSDLHLLRELQPDPGLVAYGWTDMLAAGIPLAFGTDGPVESTNPMHTIWAALTRADLNGDRSTVFQPERRMSARTALRAATSGAAYAAGLENAQGRLAPGYPADLLVTDTDLEGLDVTDAAGEYPNEDARHAHALAVRDARVSTTIVGGEVLHRL